MVTSIIGSFSFFLLSFLSTFVYQWRSCSVFVVSRWVLNVVSELNHSASLFHVLRTCDLNLWSCVSGWLHKNCALLAIIKIFTLQICISLDKILVINCFAMFSVLSSPSRQKQQKVAVAFLTALRVYACIYTCTCVYIQTYIYLFTYVHKYI